MMGMDKFPKRMELLPLQELPTDLQGRNSTAPDALEELAWLTINFLIAHRLRFC
jgi:hypothetical protein